MATTTRRTRSARPTLSVSAAEPERAVKDTQRRSASAPDTPAAAQQPTNARQKAPRTKGQEGHVRFLSRKEGRAHFDQQVRKSLGISGAEFLRRYDAGEYQDTPDDPEHWEIIRLSMLIPFAR